jgi:hypothetical protein
MNAQADELEGKKKGRKWAFIGRQKMSVFSVF